MLRSCMCQCHKYFGVNYCEHCMSYHPELIDRTKFMKTEGSEMKIIDQALLDRIGKLEIDITLTINSIQESKQYLDKLESGHLQFLDRIEELEKNREYDVISINHIQNWETKLFKINVEMQEKIAKVESQNDFLKENWDKVRDLISEEETHCAAILTLEEKVKQLESKIDKLENTTGRLCNARDEHAEDLDKLERWGMEHVQRIEKLENKPI